METLSERNKAVLQSIITNYIREALPVSSGVVAAKHAAGLSSATIRNIMAELEDLGYLKQPHTSAGRIPTDKGFRFYIDSIMKLKELPFLEKERIRSSYHIGDMAGNTAGGDMETVMKETSSILSALSMCIGVVLAPRFDNIIVKHIEFIKTNSRQIMVVLVSEAGIVQTKIIHVDDDITQPVLARLSEYVNNIANGITLRELRARVIKEMRKEKRLYDKLMKKVLLISDADIYVDGRANILSQPEFIKDMERMKEIFEAFEKKSVIVKFLDRTIETKGMQIFIGSEDEYNEIKGLSLVTATYGKDICTMGTIGVAGPIRMDYSRIIPIVDYTAKLLSNVLTEKKGN